MFIPSCMIIWYLRVGISTFLFQRHLWIQLLEWILINANFSFHQKYIYMKSKWSKLKWCHYIPPRIPLCEYSKDSCNITVVKINEFVSGKNCFLCQSLRNSSKVRFRLKFVYEGIVYVPWSVVWTWWRIAREWRLEVPKKSTLGSSSKFWLAVNFVKIHSENIAVTDTASLY